MERVRAALIAAVAGRERERVAAELDAFEPSAARRAAARAELDIVCRCVRGYPPRLLDLATPPAVLFVAGSAERMAGLAAADPVAVVGARRGSSYGREVARAFARGLAASGLSVTSGLAFGIDAAAHQGACSVGGPALAVLPGGADRVDPAAHRRLREAVLRCGVAVSELPPGTRPWRWSYPARNRIIAGLAAVTVVVEAGEGSGSLLTAATAAALRRPVAVVPGQVTLDSARGSNGLLVAGSARAVCSVQDVLDLGFAHRTEAGEGAGAPRATIPDLRGEPNAAGRTLLERIGRGCDSVPALAAGAAAPEEMMAALAELELAGFVARAPGGRYTVLP